MVGMGRVIEGSQARYVAGDPILDSSGITWVPVCVLATVPAGGRVRWIDDEHGGIVAEAREGEKIEVLAQSWRRALRVEVAGL
jgi:hypothetical protein